LKTECKKDTSEDTADISLLIKLDEATKYYLYENFTVQPLSSDIPTDALADFQVAKLHGPSEDTFDNDLDLRAFPELFPTGENGMRDAMRNMKIGTSDYIKSRLLNKDPQFRQHIGYLFHCFQLQDISNMCHSVGHMLRTVTGKSLTVQAFYERLKNRDGKMQNKLFSLMANIRGTKQYLSKLAMNVKWMINKLGPPTLLLTLSTAEWFSEPFIDYLRTVDSNIPNINSMTPSEL
jgi:hypothetical protein